MNRDIAALKRDELPLYKKRGNNQCPKCDGIAPTKEHNYNGMSIGFNEYGAFHIAVGEVMQHTCTYCKFVYSHRIE